MTPVRPIVAPRVPAPPRPTLQRLDLSYGTPAENLAADEALLDLCESGAGPEVLRFWEPAAPFVVVGYANRLETEVNLGACATLAVPVFRRISGGGTVLQGPGCLNYSLVLRIDRDPALEGIATTNRYVLERLAAALSQLLGQPVDLAGDTDLVVGGRKCAGNAQRRRRHALLFHGCLLLRLDFELVTRCLPMPSRWPSYRLARTHEHFLVNLERPPGQVRDALAAEWGAHPGAFRPSAERVAGLAATRYSRTEWTRRF